MELLKVANELIEFRNNSNQELAGIADTSLSTINRIRRKEKVAKGTLMKVISNLKKDWPEDTDYGTLMKIISKLEKE